VTIEHQPETGGRVHRNGHKPDADATEAETAAQPNRRSMGDIVLPALVLLAAVFVLRKLI
jgi:hypothetical protein